MRGSVASERAAQGSAITAVADWWGKGVFVFLTASILLLGIGRFNVALAGAGVSAWSISRTTFFFWLIWKVLLWFRDREKGLVLKHGWFPLPLLIFFGVVTLSLLPDFHEAADYRYFFFAVMHCVMIIDLFSGSDRPKLLLLLLGLFPVFLVIRGLTYNPSILNFSSVLDFDLKNRFGYPLSHPNSAGLLFCMSIPLALAMIFSQTGSLRLAIIGSLAMQFAGLILTYSRGAWFACATSLLALSLADKRFRRAVLALGLIGALGLLTITPLRNRVMMTLENPRDDVAIVGRLKFMAEAFIVGLENPLFGVGYGRDRLREGVKKESPNAQDVGFIPHSHSMYIEMLAETGLVGLGALLWMLLLNIIRLIRKARGELSRPQRMLYFSLSASLIAFLVFGLSDVPFYNHDTRIFFFTLMALTYLVLQRDVGSHRQTDSLQAEQDARGR